MSSSTNDDAGPIETRIRQKLTERLQPAELFISNDSHLHAGHAAMRTLGGGGGETHFSVEVTSREFDGKRAIQRHRIVNSILQEEFGLGLHALQIKAQTPKEAGITEKEEVATAPPASNDEKVPAGP